MVINLSKGIVGEDSANLLGAILVTTLGLAAFSRADIPEIERKPFAVLVDEFQSFTTLSVANMISELRKFGVSLVLAHQHLRQLEPEVRDTVIGNAGTVIALRMGADDAALFAREFAPVFAPEDFVGLPNHNAYIRLLVHGNPVRPFSAHLINFGDVFPQ